jgi:hypothetical protein
MAAVLACGDAAVITHRSAARLLELRQTGQRRIDVTVPVSCHSRPGIRLHRSELPREDVTRRDSIPVTTVSRTLVDLSAILKLNQLLRVVEQADRMGVLDLLAIERILARGRRPGGAKLKAILSEYRGVPATRSQLERDFLRLIETAGLPQPLVNSKVAGLEVDFFWPASRLIVELDGRAYHSSPRAFEEDRRRDARLQRAGYRVLRITFRRLRKDPMAVVGEVRAFIALAA